MGGPDLTEPDLLDGLLALALLVTVCSVMFSILGAVEFLTVKFSEVYKSWAKRKRN